MPSNGRDCSIQMRGAVLNFNSLLNCPHFHSSLAVMQQARYYHIYGSYAIELQTRDTNVSLFFSISFSAMSSEKIGLHSTGSRCHTVSALFTPIICFQLHNVCNIMITWLATLIILKKSQLKKLLCLSLEWDLHSHMKSLCAHCIMENICTYYESMINEIPFRCDRVNLSKNSYMIHNRVFSTYKGREILSRLREEIKLVSCIWEPELKLDG